MKTKKYISQNLGLGDHIITSSIVRHYCKIYDKVVLFCLPNIHKTLRSLYKDVKNLELFPIEEQMWAGANINIMSYIHNNNLEDDLITIYSFPGGPFDISFYDGNGFDYSMRFDDFYYERNLEEEEYVYNSLNPDNEKYIFVIDDGKHYTGNNFIVDDSRLPKEFKIIKHDKTLSFNDDRFVLFNYFKLLENAEEIHMIESAFTHFISSIKLDKPKIYIHSYIRGGCCSSFSTKENKFIIL